MDISKVLDETPALIARAVEEAEKLRYVWQESKLELSRLEAKKALFFKAQDLKGSVAHIQNQVNDSQEVYDLRLKVLLKETAYRKKEKYCESLTEGLNSAKMLAKLKMQEMTL